MEKKGINIKNIIMYVLSLGFAVLLLYFSFRNVQWNNFVNGLKGCNWWWIALSMTAAELACWFRGERWKATLRPIDPEMSSVSTFNAINIGYIANFIFPRIGEFVRCGYVSTKKASYDKVLGTVVLERSWDMVMMLLILLLLLIFKWDEFGTFFVENMWQPMVGRFEMGALWILIGVAALALLCTGFLLLWIFRKKDSNRVAAKLYSLVAGLFKGLMSFTKMERKLPFFVHTVLIWLMYWVMAYATLRAIPSLSALGGDDALFLMIAGSFGWIVPVPGGFGAYHWIVATASATVYSLPFADGIVFATLSHESQAIVMVVFGLISFVWASFARGKEKAE